MSIRTGLKPLHGALEPSPTPHQGGQFFLSGLLRVRYGNLRTPSGSRVHRLGESGSGRYTARLNYSGAPVSTKGAENRPRKSRSHRDGNTTIDLSRHQLMECLLRGTGNGNLVKNARLRCQRSREGGIHTVSASLCFWQRSRKGPKSSQGFQRSISRSQA